MDRKDMKIEALKQRLAEITVQYEDRDADRRIEITEMAQKIKELEDALIELQEAKPDEVKEDGEVVHNVTTL